MVSSPSLLPVERQTSPDAILATFNKARHPDSDRGYETRPEPEAFWLLSAGAAGYVFGQTLREPITTSVAPFFLPEDQETRVENNVINELLRRILLSIQPENTKAAISTIKFNFSLNHSQLADVLRVTRPTIYTWLDEEADVRIQPHHQHRIEQLASYATFWWGKARRRLPKGLFDSKVGTMLLDLLQAEVLEDQFIRWAIEKLSAQCLAERRLVTVKGVGSVPIDESLTIEEIADF